MASDPLSVSIDFETSHLFFPHIVHWVLAGLFALILVTKVVPFLAAVKRGERTLPIIGESRDSARFFGTLALICAYFYLMAVVGDLFPYTGYGFLFVSMAFVLVMSLMYLHEWTKKALIIVVINAIVAPTLAWFVLAKLFTITLP
ncbi:MULTISPECIES: tripartite tricarboxylate transporter TctB family protein [unclassified Halomonas]|uniref:tripartite tricarboxylate transporter TctB family protein n=1 Tax=unclassified Halomonas TaxID=2609666 RepID=UPI0021E46CAB|nr:MULTISPECIES: tripartite tricarboxylate transporter TctB family protein [unclassified Halomonas]UYG00732.1 tripartite tricarboxylate transporter [Halomonas sp. GD1P12]WNL38212.1 tripartite tricarboxylate transporter [Halomonas sp. PAMB 3232]WNL41512.1 tripartite tricarboxylate transporter [Halomonas sp. PAMB 3264]